MNFYALHKLQVNFSFFILQSLLKFFWIIATWQFINLVTAHEYVILPLPQMPPFLFNTASWNEKVL